MTLGVMQPRNWNEVTGRGDRPKPGLYPLRTVKHSPLLDSNRRRVTDDPTPEKFTQWLRAAEEGDVAALCEMQEEMEAKSAHLQGVVNTRRTALTALEWDIEPEIDTKEPGQAAIAANYCRDRLRKLKSFPLALEHLSTAIGANVAVLEYVWLRGELMRFVEVPCHRLELDPHNRTNAMHIITDADMVKGVSTKQWAYKFGVFHPHNQSGFPFRRTLTHATVWPYIVGHFARTDWMAFIELYGTPIRTGKTNEAFNPEDREVVEDMLNNMGTDTAATFPDGVDVTLLQAAGTGETFKDALDWSESKLSILWLGQTGTVDLGDVGSRAAVQVHRRVQADILFGDIQAEARFVRSSILEPMTRLRFPGADVPVPSFARKPEEAVDTESARLRMEQIKTATDLGLPVDPAQVYSDLDLQRPLAKPTEDGGEDVTTDIKAQAATINELTLGLERAVRAMDLGLVNALRRKIAGLLGTSLEDLAELAIPGDNSGEQDKATEEEDAQGQ